MVRTRVTGLLLASALTGAGVTSCSDETDPRTAPTSTATSTAPTTPPPTSDSTPDPKEPVEPKLPAAAKAPTRAGAEAFVRYYIKLLNYASQTGGTQGLTGTADECIGCRKYEHLFSRTYENGGSFVGNLWRPFGFTVARGPDGFFVLTQVKAEAGKFTPNAGARPRPLEADTYSLRFTLTRSGGSWFVTTFEGR